ncbi:Protein of unknown function [Pyronema omphalodes CBS 100304]|uniref:Uncharacterized protein n=1 Tax=Pyronema omphalodes (strain CBS 100304) TaxID=1076935 RepID=U4L831_PYROM|nr:Protein of unknown function [Pyronema omphalodes CBS 100304]
MVTSEPEVYSTTLPQNLRTTDPLISALANYMIGVQTLFANFAEIKANAGRLGFPNPEELNAGIAPTKYVAMAINYRQHHAALIEDMNQFLYKTVEASGFMSTLKVVGQQIELIEINEQMFQENIKMLENAVNTEEVSTAMQFIPYYCYKKLTTSQ